MPFFQNKITLAGNSLELKTYSHPILYDSKIPYKFKRFRRKSLFPVFRLSNLFRTRRNLRQLILTNVSKDYLPIFITLTFRDNVIDLGQANLFLKKFILRLNYAQNIQLKYVAIPEIQYRREKKYGHAVWHYHLLAFNLPFIPDLQSYLTTVWGNGLAFYKSVFNDVLHVANYVAKYLTKDHWETRLYARKKYFASRNLKRPLLTREDNLSEIIIQKYLKIPTYRNVTTIDKFTLQIITQIYKLTEQQRSEIQTLMLF